MDRIDPDKMVVGFAVYRNGTVEINRRGTPTTTKSGIRGDIVRFTQRARDKLLFVASATDVTFWSMITLTYPTDFPADGKAAKMDLKIFRQRLVREYGCEILWFLEFQARGAPHFHILSTVKTPSNDDRFRMAYMWAEIVCKRPGEGKKYPDHEAYMASFAKVWRVHAHSRSWEPIKKDKGAIRYAAKYATKTRQKEVPPEYSNCGSFWGCTSAVREGAKPIAVVDADARQIRDILEAEGHKVSKFDWLPRYIWAVDAVNVG